jgi:hypothetical protein
MAVPAMSGWLSLTLLRIAVLVGGCVPVGAGLAGLLAGPGMMGEAMASVSADSHFRYLSGLLLAIGLGFWSCIPALARRTGRMRLLTAVVVLGGLARLFGVAQRGWPDAPMVFGLGMELAVTPLLCLWQTQVSRRQANAAEP